MTQQDDKIYLKEKKERRKPFLPTTVVGYEWLLKMLILCLSKVPTDNVNVSVSPTPTKVPAIIYPLPLPPSLACINIKQENCITLLLSHTLALKFSLVLFFFFFSFYSFLPPPPPQFIYLLIYLFLMTKEKKKNIQQSRIQFSRERALEIIIKGFY